MSDVDPPSPPFAATVWTEPWPRRVRAMVDGVAVADSTLVRLLFERDHRPIFYFPPEDVRAELVERAEKTSHCPRKGDASYWSIRVGDRLVPDAVWSYESPLPGREDIAGYRAFYWHKVDAWFEEDDEIFVHAKDPYARIDVLNSSRHVVVSLNGEVLADTTRPRLLFETGLPTRYYVPKADVRMDVLTPTDTSTQCPYKGVASYWSATVGDATVDDIAWSYPFPIPECPKIEGLVCFFNERTDITIDDELQPRPRTVWS
jgi:uncharacterized protein (DUF427 family)